MASDRVVRSLVRDLEPVRPLRSAEARTRLWGGFALLCVSLGTWAFGARPDLRSKLHDPAYLRESALLLFVFAFSARSAFQLSVPGAERSATTRGLPILGLVAWACLVATGHLPGSGDALAAVAGWPCVLKMIGLSLAPAFAVLLMLRKAASLRPGWTGWFALLSATSLAILGTRIVCAKDDPRHVFLWHFGPLLAAALLGIHLGRWILTRRGLGD